MNRSTLVALGFAGALALIAAPASAQHHRDGGGGEQRHDNAAPRGESRGGSRGESRRESRPAPEAQRQAQPAPRQQQEQHAAPRQEQRAVPREDFRATPRTYAPRYQPRYESRYSAPRYYDGGGRYYGPRYVGPRFSIAPRHFYRPYYAFRPRLSIGFGLWAGYPISYYDPYYYPYEYYPYATAQPGYPLPPTGSVNVQPDQTRMGGVSFQITPDSAEVWVDGNYFGTVGQFTPESQPLGLTAGRHHVELREPGYDVSSFDVDIVAGQVMPYSGTLQ